MLMTDLQAGRMMNKRNDFPRRIRIAARSFGFRCIGRLLFIHSILTPDANWFNELLALRANYTRN